MKLIASSMILFHYCRLLNCSYLFKDLSICNLKNSQCLYKTVSLNTKKNCGCTVDSVILNIGKHTALWQWTGLQRTIWQFICHLSIIHLNVPKMLSGVIVHAVISESSSCLCYIVGHSNVCRFLYKWKTQCLNLAASCS